MDISNMTIDEIQKYVTELEAKVGGVEAKRSRMLNRVSILTTELNRIILTKDVQEMDIEVINDIVHFDDPYGEVSYSDRPHWRHFKVSLFY